MYLTKQKKELEKRCNKFLLEINSKKTNRYCVKKKCIGNVYKSTNFNYKILICDRCYLEDSIKYKSVF